MQIWRLQQGAVVKYLSDFSHLVLQEFCSCWISVKGWSLSDITRLVIYFELIWTVRDVLLVRFINSFQSYDIKWWHFFSPAKPSPLKITPSTSVSMWGKNKTKNKHCFVFYYHFYNCRITCRTSSCFEYLWFNAQNLYLLLFVCSSCTFPPFCFAFHFPFWLFKGKAYIKSHPYLVHFVQLF